MDVREALEKVTRAQIRAAIQEFSREYPNTCDYDGWLHKRSYIYALLYEGKLYPPKEIMSRATGIGRRKGLYGGCRKPYGVNFYFCREGFMIKRKPSL
jgi:5-methylcytosine-specific restriction protein A